jgi:hypothetical protein
MLCLQLYPSPCPFCCGIISPGFILQLRFSRQNSFWQIVLIGLDASGRIHTRDVGAPSSIPRVAEINILIVVSYLLGE